MSNCGFSKINRYLLVGLVATGLQFTILQLAVLVGIKPLMGSIVGYALSAVFNYSANRKWTFGFKESHTATFVKFIIITGLGFLANAIIFHFTIKQLHYMSAQVISTISAISINYIGNAYWTFSRGESFIRK